MQRLAELPDARLRWLGPQGLTPPEALARLKPLLAALGPHHAALLATPVRTEGGLAWEAPGEATLAMPRMSREQRAVFDATLTVLLSDIRRAAETARAKGDAATAELLDLVRRVSAPELVFAVDGAPVLAGWGFAAPQGPAITVLGPFDDGRGASALPGDRTAIALAGGALLALALAAVLAAPFLVALLNPPLPACRVDAAGLAALEELDRAREQGRGLMAERDRLRQDRGRRMAECPLPEPPAAPEPAPTPPAPPPTPPAPPPRAALPQERWDRGDVALLEGCWNLDSNYRTRDVDTGRIDTVRSWRMCFDRNGRGTQTMVYDNNRRCTGPVTGRFEGQTLLIDDTADLPCDDGYRVLHRLARCQRSNETRAECESRNVRNPTAPGSRFTLRR
ncbi:hypothetical protein [Falsiroseomonas ponticola]|uniref:hypothetical protein n=1 Tax=Falsiroseomonas ponticola TaxID=2786951 RepID=UPI001934A941|nr:hypothetical protein [Roseomonas ponticola]